MKNRRTVMWMGLLMVVAMAVSACGGIVRGEAEPESPVDVGAPSGEFTEGLAVIDEMYVIKMERLPASVGAIVSGNLPDGCTELGEAVVTHEGNTFLVELPTTRDPDAMCTMALVPFQVAIPLDVLGLPAGTYTVDVNGVTDTFTFEIDNVLQE
jgi:inhibitor of cysteine peptidase